jgi:ankyrin repeat protein
MVDLLLSRGAKANGGETGMSNPLHAAIESDRDDESARSMIVRVLLDHGADINKRSTHMSTWLPTPLLVAVHEKRTSIALLLIERGADIHAQTGSLDGITGNVTALMYAAENGLDDVVRALLAKGAPANQRNENGVTPLAVVAANDHKTIIELLIAGGADVNARTAKGRTPLILARWHEVAELLITSGADVNAADHEGWTALMFAAERGNDEIAKSLLNHGADIKKVNEDGDTALTIAEKNNQPRLARMLAKWPKE